LTITPEISWGQILAILVPLIVGGIGIYVAYVVFRTKTEGAVKVVQDGLIDTNERFSKLAAGTVAHSNELRDFKDHVSRHYVEKDEIADLRMSFDRNWDRMETKIDAAVGTMSDVRDEVIKLTSKGGQSNVPPARRPTAKARV
jgi:hypothetical protein